MANLETTLIKIAEELEKAASVEAEVGRIKKMAHMLNAVNALSILKQASQPLNKEAAFWNKEEKERHIGSTALKGLLGGATIGGIGGAAGTKWFERVLQKSWEQERDKVAKANWFQKWMRKVFNIKLPPKPKFSPKQFALISLLGALGGAAIGGGSSALGETVLGTKKRKKMLPWS